MSKKSVTYYPAFLNLLEKRCVVIGGGRIAERKARELLKAGARVTIISPDVTPGLQRLFGAGKIQYAKRKYRKGDTKNAFLVIAATSDEKVNKQIAAHTRGLLNAVDMPGLCSFITPSVIRRGPLCIAISSSGISPALSKTLRKEIEHTLPDELPQYLAYLSKVRQGLLKSLPGPSRKNARKRALLLKEAGSRKTLSMLKQKKLADVKLHLEALIKDDYQRRNSKYSLQPCIS